MATRILLVDDHTAVRQALRGFLDQQSGLKVVGEADNGRDAIRLAGELRPDVVVLDIAMPDLNGIDATHQLKDLNEYVQIIAMTMHADDRYVRGMFDAGASGYVLKTCVLDELLRAIDAVVRDRVYISPEVAHVLVDSPGRRGEPGVKAGPEGPLSPKERQVLQLLAEGKSSKQIASRLDLAVKTVETHRANLMHKLDLHSIAELTKYAVREGLTSL